jgi:hypothetical protein
MLNKAKLVAHQEDMASAEGPTRLDRFPLITIRVRKEAVIDRPFFVELAGKLHRDPLILMLSSNISW